MKTEIKNVRLIWDEENGGWYTHHDEPDQQHLDHGLDTVTAAWIAEDIDRDEVDLALAAARKMLGLDDKTKIEVHG